MVTVVRKVADFWHNEPKAFLKKDKLKGASVAEHEELMVLNLPHEIREAETIFCRIQNQSDCLAFFTIASHVTYISEILALCCH